MYIHVHALISVAEHKKRISEKLEMSMAGDGECPASAQGAAESPEQKEGSHNDSTSTDSQSSTSNNTSAAQVAIPEGGEPAQFVQRASKPHLSVGEERCGFTAA